MVPALHSICRTLPALLLVIPALVMASDHDVDQWLDKMASALRTQNYEGIFTYMRGHQFDTVQVVHRYEDGNEVERLLHLNGEQREIIRRNGTVICRHKKKDGAVDFNHEVPLGPFTHAFNENLSNYQSLYDFELQGTDRVANRTAVKLVITPKHDDRWGYRLWLDEETGLLLQSHLVGRNRVLEVFQFTRVDIGREIADAELETVLADNVTVHQLIPPENSGEPALAKPRWRVAWLPSGFRQVPSPRPDRIVFTDGIATVSVFIDPRQNSFSGEIATHTGGTAVITRQLKGSAQQITVVGEVPVDTARKVAESIEPVLY